MKKFKYKGRAYGIPIGIHDKNGKELCIGDKILYGGVACIVLWDSDCLCYRAFLLSSKWYGENDYDFNSYGKCYELSADEGARILIEKV